MQERRWSLGGRLAAVWAAAVATCAGLAVGAGPNPGPDVIVGTLPDTVSFGGNVGDSTGPLAFDLGTTSCNVGNVNLRWEASTTQHPVIAQNVYRLKDGRFEQIGQSWVKHGFFALTETLCGACNEMGGNVLGIGCSDPYDSGLNGLQAGLGPRSQIQSATGQFPFVPSTWPPVTGELSRRINIARADIDPAQNVGALYFGEAVYIAPDDAAAGNGWNNVSYRPMSFAAGGASAPAFVSAMFGQAVREKPALFAWAAGDPNVRIVGIDVPGEGVNGQSARFWIAENVTQPTPGQYRYEYAIYNLNSDRAGGGFVVPRPTGAVVQAAAVKIAPAHSGEPYTNEPWAIVTTAEQVAFRTPQTFAQNPNSSAIRWGTLHNISFTSTTPPGDGLAALELFKPAPTSGPGAGLQSVPVRVRTPGGASVAVQAPGNDECSGAVPLHAGENRISTIGATTSASPADCAPIHTDVWYSYTFRSYALGEGGSGGCPGTITFETCGSEFDTKIAVYNAGQGGQLGPSVCGGSVAPLACSDDALPANCTSGFAGGSSVSRVVVPAVEGQTYLIRVGSAVIGPGPSQSGHGVLTITPPWCVPAMGACCRPSGVCTMTPGASSCFVGTFVASSTCDPNPCPLPPPPVNNQCGNAIALGDTALGAPSVLGTNILATNEILDACGGGNGRMDVWYTYTPAMTGPFVVDLCQATPSGDAFDSVLSARAGSCVGAALVCNDDFCGPLSRISVNGVAGVTYMLRVSGYLGAMAEFVIRVTGGGGLPPGLVGACCDGATCGVTLPSACTGAARRFSGTGTTCNASGVSTTPCCYADFDQSGQVNVPDIFAFLESWFAPSPRAVVGGNGQSGLPGVPDIFAFLGLWFAGC